jgi:hypothetical protein
MSTTAVVDILRAALSEEVVATIDALGIISVFYKSKNFSVDIKLAEYHQLGL